MRYESEILYDLMKRDGLLNPSQDNLPYESELKEKYVNEVEGAYPKLQDYRAEWLNYNKCEYIPADFPTESQTNQTSGTFENVIPFAYERAILTGQTLVNELTGEIYSNSQNTSIDYYINKNLNANDNYTVIFNLEYDGKSAYCGITKNSGTWNSNQKPISNGYVKLLLTTTTETAFSLRIRADDKPLTITKCMLINGDYTNQDIPYFEGMQSVQMPVLTTSNGDGTKTNILTVNEDVTLRSNGNVCDELDLLTGKLTQRIDEDGSVLTQEVVKTVDLSCINEDNVECDFIPIMDTMHYQTSSDTIPPLADLTVCVEATTQNLASFVHLEGVEENE